MGTGNNLTYSSPVQVGGSWAQAMVMCDSSAGGFAAGIKVDGTLWIWGGNGNGDLGLGNSTVQYSSPVQLGSDRWTMINISSCSSAAAIRTDGTLWMWGRNDYGILGQNMVSSGISSPVQVSGQWKQAYIIQTDNAAVTLALRNDGTLWAWGDNSSGLFGRGDTVSYSSPVQVGSGTWSTIGGGWETVMALK